MTNLKFISCESPDFDRLCAFYLNGIYFDGKTEDCFKYDCCGLLNGMLTYGIHDCTIRGYPAHCRAYIWDYVHGHFSVIRILAPPRVTRAESTRIGTPASHSRGCH